MINNSQQYDKELYKNAFNFIKDIDIPTNERIVVESALRNQCMVLTGTDLGEPLSFDDVYISGTLKNDLIKCYNYINERKSRFR